MTKTIRVNIRALANAKAARKEKRNGRDVMVVPSATLPDNIVMNGILYPADEIEKSFMSLNRSPAPAGHPTINGRFVSARDPEGINIGWVGAWNENVRRENGRVFLDKVIDIETANRTEKGKAILKAIDDGEPIHTSTGLFLELEEANAKDHKWIGRNMQFDHDAILLGEEGAATPEQGVGMMVNSKGEDEEIEVVNSAIDMADQELDWAGMHLLSALERRERASTWERIKSAIMDALPGAAERETSTNEKENDMAVSEEQFKALSDEVKTLSDSIGDTIANAVKEAIKPVTEHVEQIAANQKAADEAARAEAVNKLVETGQWTEDDLKEMPLAAINKLVEKSKPGKAFGMNGQFKAGGNEGGFKLPKAEA